MSIRFVVILAALVASVSPVLAQDVSVPAAALPAPAAAPTAKSVKPKKICRRDTETGSIMPSTICHTKEEWQQIDGTSQTPDGRVLASPSRSTGIGH